MTTFKYDATKQLSNLTNDFNNQQESESKLLNSLVESEKGNETKVSTISLHSDDSTICKMNGILHNLLIPSNVIKSDSNNENYNKDNCLVEQFTSSNIAKVHKNTICGTNGINMTSSIELEEKVLNGDLIQQENVHSKGKKIKLLIYIAYCKY